FFDVDTTNTFKAQVLGVVVTGTTGTEAPTNAAFLAMLTTPTDGVSGTTVTEAGGIPWSFTGGEDKFDYLALNESVTLTYTIQVKDNDGGTDTQTVTITVEGRNDNPVITTDSGTNVTQTLHEAAETSATPQDNAGNLTASGNLAFFDVDTTNTFKAQVLGVVVTGTTGTEAPTNAALLAMLTTPTDAVSGTTVTEAGGIPWSFTGGEDKFDYLALNESVTLTYTIQVKDNDGGTDTQTVTITVEGRNDNPVI